MEHSRKLTKGNSKIGQKSRKFTDFVTEEHYPEDDKEQSAQEHYRAHKPVNYFRTTEKGVYSKGGEKKWQGKAEGIEEKELQSV